jgi:hypothetical protein
MVVVEGERGGVHLSKNLATRAPMRLRSVRGMLVMDGDDDNDGVSTICMLKMKKAAGVAPDLLCAVDEARH